MEMTRKIENTGVGNENCSAAENFLDFRRLKCTILSLNSCPCSFCCKIHFKKRNEEGCKLKLKKKARFPKVFF